MARLSRFWFLLPAALAALMSFIIVPLSVRSQELAHRLILKDGSYQLVTHYEVKGDRVRYKSAERDEWEELPTSLVDWPATEKYKQERATTAIPEAAAVDKESEADREGEESHLPQVAPGLRLPEASGVFLLDNFQGQPQLVEMQQTECDVNRSARGNIFRGGLNPVAGVKQNVEIGGEHAAIHAHVSVPSIYINVDEDEASIPEGSPSGKQSDRNVETSRSQPQQPQQPQQPERAVVPFNRFRIVHVKVKGGKRIVGDVKRAPSSKASQEQNFVKTTINQVSGGWLKLTPTEDLAPGEYALVEMKGNEGMNLYVWDFGVDPNAAANTNPWKPHPPDK